MLADRTLRTLGARSLAARGTQSRLAAQKLPVVATQTRNFALAHKTEIDDERMPTTYADYSNHVLLMLSAHGDDQAIRERMVRDVMKVDSVDHVEAETKVQEIEQAAKSGLAMSRLPYRVGIAAALVAGFGSIPMCFDLHTVLWFNEQYVTMDVEDAKNLETWLEVGSWSWNWMEPPLGTISFFLLCMQYSRDQRLNMGQKPYTEWYKSQRADRLAAAFPAYTTEIVRDYAKATAFDHSDCDGIDDMPNDPNATDADIADTGKGRSDVGRQRAAR